MKRNYVNLPGEWPGRITSDKRGRLRIYLGKRRCQSCAGLGASCNVCDGKGYRVPEPANSGGWQWLSRFLVWQRTGVVLPTAIHTHHQDGKMDSLDVDPIPRHLHGRIHAFASNPYRRRGADGRWLPQPEDEPIPSFSSLVSSGEVQP